MLLSVCLPAYKEDENLLNIIPAIHKSLAYYDHEIVVISEQQKSDVTFNICNELNAEYVNREGGNDYGDAIRTAFDVAKGKYLVIMDADGSHDPKSILDMISKMESSNCDLVIGSRYCKGGFTDNNFILRFMS